MRAKRCVKLPIEVDYEGGVWAIKVGGRVVATVEIDWSLYERVGAEEVPWEVDEMVYVEPLEDYIEVCVDEESEARL